MIKAIDVYKMINLKNALIDFKNYYIKNKKKTDQNIKERLSIINEDSCLNVIYCITYYHSLPGNYSPVSKKGGGFFNKIQIQPIINDLISKLELIIKEQDLINESIESLRNDSLFKKDKIKSIKSKTMALLTLCKNYIFELQNLNAKIYEKKKYKNIETDYSNGLLKLTMNNINTAIKNAFLSLEVLPVQSRAVPVQSRAVRVPSRVSPPQSRVSSKSSLSSKYDADVIEEYENLLAQIEKEEKEEKKRKNGTSQGGRIKRVKNENKKMNEKVAKKK
jgi:hypothetical protein